MSILRFDGARFRKAPGAASKRDPISKKFCISHFFWLKAKMKHPCKLKLKNDPKRVCPTVTCPHIYHTRWKKMTDFDGLMQTVVYIRIVVCYFHC